MTLAKVKAKTNETFIVKASLTIVTYNCQNMFIVQATGVLHHAKLEMLFRDLHSILSGPCLRNEENKVL
jgi:hypothetical protein